MACSCLLKEKLIKSFGTCLEYIITFLYLQKVCSEEILYHRYQKLHRQTGQKYAGGHMRSSKINFRIKKY